MVNSSAGIGKIVYGKSPDVLSAIALGSCVGVVIYDPLIKISGLAHVVLPKSSENKARNLERDRDRPGKYADLAIPTLINKLKRMGALKLHAKIAGGAGVFKILIENYTDHIGIRNSNAVVEQLKKYRIPIIAADVGGEASRTIQFYTETLTFKLKKTTTIETMKNYKIEYEFL